MRYIFSNLVLIAALAGGLAGCPSQYVTRNVLEKTSQETVPPALAPMQYNWKTNYSSMLTPPLEIREKALQACKQRGFDRAYMLSVSLNSDLATANFSCRGSDH